MDDGTKFDTIFIYLHCNSIVMELKKSKEADNESLKGPAMMIGLLFIGSLVLASFSYTTAIEREVNDKVVENLSEDSFEQQAEEPKEEPPQQETAVEVPPPPAEEIVEEENKEEPPKKIVPVPPPVVVEKEQVKVAEEIIEFPDVEASYPGGAAALKQYIRDNVVYPEMAMEMNEQGKVYLSFVVEKDGKITNIKVERGVSSDLDREAKRVVRSMPKWVPGETKGKSVRTKCSLPIVFVIQ
jgi:protein TonB